MLVVFIFLSFLSLFRPQSFYAVEPPVKKQAFIHVWTKAYDQATSVFVHKKISTHNHTRPNSTARNTVDAYSLCRFRAALVSPFSKAFTAAFPPSAALFKQVSSLTSLSHRFKIIVFLSFSNVNIFF